MTTIKRYVLILLIMLLAFPVPSSSALDLPVELAAKEPVIAPDEPAQTTPQSNPSEQQKDNTETQSAAPLVQPTIPAENSEVQVDAPIKLQQTPIPASKEIIVSGIEVVDDTLNALELRSMSDDFINLSAWRVEVVFVVDGVEESCEVALSGFMQPRQYITVIREGVPVQLEHQNGAQAYEANLDCGLTDKKLAYIELYNGTNTADITERVMIESASDVNGRWIRKGLTTTNRTGIFLTDFSRPSPARLLYYGVVYEPPVSVPLQITELLVTPSACAPNDASVICGRYIKVYNSSDWPIDLSNYRLRGGMLTSVSTASNTTALTGIVGPKQSTVIKSSATGAAIYLASTEGSVWFEDKYGLKDYRNDSPVAPYSGATNVSNTGRSWAFDKVTNSWRWGVPSPYDENTFITEDTGKGSAGGDNLKPCRDDQYRSEETNRCRSIASSGSGLAPCKEGQYRSEETNRCRSIASVAAAALKPCADDQFRSPETNRCRKIASSDDAAFADCGEGRERNPETNRCRNVLNSAVPEAAFAVERVKDAGKAFIGWWALGGVGMLAFGYGIWEWHREILTKIQKVVTFFTSAK